MNRYSILRPATAEPYDVPTRTTVSDSRKDVEAELEATLQGLAERARYITGATGVAVALAQRDSEEMICRAACGSLAPPVGARLQIRSGLSGEAVRTGLPLRCDDASTDERVNRESCEAFGISSLLVSRIAKKDGVLGIFELFSGRSFAFGERETLALKSITRILESALAEAGEAGLELWWLPWTEEQRAAMPPELDRGSERAAVMELRREEKLPPFLERLADEAEAYSGRSWSQWFRPQW